MSVTVQWIQEKVLLEKYELSTHAEEEREADKITIDDLEKALSECEIIEDYSEDPRGASYLVLGYDLNKRPIHLVCGSTPSGKLRIITVYIPTLPKWLDPKTRVGKR